MDEFFLGPSLFVYKDIDPIAGRGIEFRNRRLENSAGSGGDKVEWDAPTPPRRSPLCSAREEEARRVRRKASSALSKAEHRVRLRASRSPKVVS